MRSIVGFQTACASPRPLRKTTRRLLAASPSKRSYATGAFGLEGSATVGMLNQTNALNGSQSWREELQSLLVALTDDENSYGIELTYNKRPPGR
jgi:hypothetical protein